jgi:hypothetical protein
MLSLLWVFGGFIVGLFVVSIFDPPFRTVPSLPSPGDHDIFRVQKGGCVRIISEETACTSDAISLGVINDSERLA